MENRSGGWELLGGLAIGALGGFLMGVMVAPRAHGDQREAIADMRHRTTDLLETVRGSAETLLSSTRSTIEEKMTLLNDAIDAGRRAAEYKRAELIETDNEIR
jgi:hypothetical protein